MKKTTVPSLLILLLFLNSCAMLLQPTSSFDRRLVAMRYGKILSQAHPECMECSDSFLIEKRDGRVMTLLYKYDGQLRVID